MLRVFGGRNPGIGVDWEYELKCATVTVGLFHRVLTV